MSKPTAGRITRRNALKIGATAAALPLVHIRTAAAAGKLSIGFWDHWVPAGNAAMQKQVNAWAEKNKVEVQADFITTQGNKLLLTSAAEDQAKTGHDVLTFLQWDALNHADSLEPMDDVMGRLTAQYGGVNDICAYTGKAKGHWLGVPSSSGAQNKGPCGRISILKEAAGITSGAAKTGREFAGKVTKAQCAEIAQKKMKDLNANDLAAATRIIEGSARAMGLQVVE